MPNCAAHYTRKAQARQSAFSLASLGRKQPTACSIMAGSKRPPQRDQPSKNPPMHPHHPQPCPCTRQDAKGRILPYAQCCGPYRAGTAPAPDAERLMRSRYSAFVQGDAAYLLRTWHPSTRPDSLDLDSEAKWLGLEVRRHHKTGEHSATVEFVARHRLAGRAVRQHEVSRFVCEDGQWFYVDGDVR